MVSSEFGLSASLSGTQTRFAKMFAKPNAERPIVNTLAHTLEVLGGMLRGVRRKDDRLIQQFAPKALAWQCALATKLDVNLEDALWAKYPRICPYCTRAQDCACIIFGKQPIQEDEVRRRAETEERPETIRDWQAMFRSIYGNVNAQLGVPAIGLHLFEEFAELSEVIREGATEYYPLELADLLAWYFALTTLTIQDVDFYLKDAYHTCHRCKDITCDCPWDRKLGLRLVGT